jgi:hypothetical protein
METQKYGNNLEKSTFRLLYRDGIFDLAFGSMLIIYSINMYLDINDIQTSIIFRLLIIPVVVILALIKAFITQKRIGYAKFKPGRNRKRLVSYLIAISALLFTTIIYILAAGGKIESSDKNEWFSLLIEFIFLVGIFFLMAYFTDYYKFYLVGIIMGLASPASIFLEPYLGTRYFGLALQFIAGTYLFISGIILFSTFLVKFPKAGNYEG